jgi:DNA mismatch repair protein MutL
VRFADPQAIHRLLREAVRAAVSRRGWIAPAVRASGADGLPAPVTAPSAATPRASGAAGDWLFATRADDAGAVREGPPELEPEPERIRLGELRLLGQLLATYLVLEAKDQLVLVDQHAGHERVLYERLRAEWLARGVFRQGLLAPLAVELEARSFAALAGQGDALEKLGFEIEAFGERTVALRSVPALLSDRDPAALVRSLAEALAEGSGSLTPAGALRSLAPADRLFATLACHGARRKGDLLDPREQRALLDALDAIPWAPTCPHGRPVAVPIPLHEIERRFGRR